MSLMIGVDIGGTKVLGGVVNPDGEVLATARRETPARDVPGLLNLISQVIEELSFGRQVAGVGIGAAGWIDAARSTVLFSPNLAWRNEPLRDVISEVVNLPVVVENDANVAAWAEHRFGAGRDSGDSMVMITIGTGIGGGVVRDGRLARGAHGIASELGHVNSVPDGHPCGCGRRGCLEQYASGSALVRFAQTATKDDPGSASALLAMAGGQPGGITGKMVTKAARDGDPVACGAFDQVGHWLGLALADFTMILDPHVIVIGGGVIDAGDLLLGPARRTYADSLGQRGRLPVAELRPALMGNTAGVVGAADLARGC